MNNGFLVASEEEVDPSQHALDRTQTLVLMDPDSQTGSLIYEEAASIIEEQVGWLSLKLTSVCIVSR